MSKVVIFLASGLAALLAGNAVAAAQAAPGVADVRSLLLRGAWVHEVRTGRVFIESRELVFRETGAVRERIRDDTGMHDAEGTWELEQADGAVVLVLAGAGLRDRGRYAVHRMPNDDAVELRLVAGGRVLRFERRPERPASQASEQDVRQTIAAFWKALGDLDAHGLGRALDWPNVIVEARPDRLADPATVNADAAALEAEMRRTLEGKGARKGDFHGTTVSTIEVRFVSVGLAYAYHVCRLGGEAGDRSTTRGGSRDFEAIAVLRATGDAGSPWRIVLITVPK